MTRTERNENVFPSIQGEMAERVRAHNWAATPLGAIAQWPQSLATLVALMLSSRQPMFMAWGPQQIWLYNDAFIPIAGEKHPRALGRSAADVWSEIWTDIQPLFTQVFAGGAVQMDDISLQIDRHGMPEESHFAFAYTPVPGEDGAVAGLFGTCIETTEQVLADAALRRSEERLRRATENAEVGLWDIDADENISFFYARDAFSMPQDRKIPWEDFIAHVHPEDAPALRAAYAAARDAKTRPVMDIEYRTLAIGDIPARWMAVKGRGIFDSAGRCVRMSGTAVDVTSRKQAEMNLRENEEKLRLATEHAEIGLWDVDNVTGTLYWPPRVKSMFGIAADKPVSMTGDFYAGLHPDDRERVSAAYAAACDPGKRAPYDVEYRTIGKEDGIVRWVHAKGRGIFDTDGRCTRVIGTAIDITRQKETAEALHRNEEQLRLATEFAEVGLWDVDISSDALYWPPRVNAMFGLPPDVPVTLKEFRAFLHPEDRRRVIAATIDACDTAKRAPYDIEYRIVRQDDGAVRWMTARGRAVFAADGKRCLRMLGIVVDITARKEAELRVRELNETLERRVAERTAALEKSEAQIRNAEQALQQAQKMEAIGNLTGGIAHDFNNLLQGVAGSLDLIRRKPEDVERVRRWAEAGLQAAERGAKLTGQMLAFSRSQKLELRPVDLSSLLTGMRELLGRTLGPSIRVRMELDTGATNVMGDETQLEMSVLNLAINARDAMPDGGELTIATRLHRSEGDAHLAPGEYVELMVADTGSGMPADIAARAFDPFFTTKGVGKGTGLGLSQVYGMARQAGGTARIQSTPGKGTTVSIYLPFTQAVAQTSAAREEGTHLKSAPATVLVIDDDQDVRRFLTNSLNTFGYAVQEAAGGEDGLAALAHGVPDLLIVDYAMPGMTGAELARHVRAKHPRLPIIFASGYAETSALDSVAENSIVLRKPFRVSELQNAVRIALGR